MTVYHIIGDVHGNAAPLRAMLEKLGCEQPEPEARPELWRPPPDEQVLFLGDLVDRGMSNLDSLRIARAMVLDGSAQMVLGNHDLRMIGLLRSQLGLAERPRLAPGRLMTWVELLGVDDGEKRSLLEFLERCPPFLSLDDHRLVVVHARWNDLFRLLSPEELLLACVFGRAPGDGKRHVASDPEPVDGDRPLIRIDSSTSLPQRALWTREHSGTRRTLVAWGHHIVRRGSVTQIGRTVNVESGCFLGYPLSAYTYPEGRVTQAPGSVSWRRQLVPYLPVAGTVLPTSLADVVELIRQEQLERLEDYLAWLELIVEEAGAPPLPLELELTHRRIWARAAVDHGSSSSGSARTSRSLSRDSWPRR